MSSLDSDIKSLASAVALLLNYVPGTEASRKAVKDIAIRASARIDSGGGGAPRITPEAIERLTGILWRMTDEFESDESRFYWRRAIKDFERVIYGREPKDPIRPPKPRGSADKVRELLSRKAPWEKTTPAERIEAQIHEERAAAFRANLESGAHDALMNVNKMFEGPSWNAAKLKGAEKYGNPMWNKLTGWHDIKTEPLPPVPIDYDDNTYLLVSDGDLTRLLWADSDFQEWVIVTNGEFVRLKDDGYTWTHWRKVEMPT